MGRVSAVPTRNVQKHESPPEPMMTIMLEACLRPSLGQSSAAPLLVACQAPPKRAEDHPLHRADGNGAHLRRLATGLRGLRELRGVGVCCVGSQGFRRQIVKSLVSLSVVSLHLGPWREGGFDGRAVEKVSEVDAAPADCVSRVPWVVSFGRDRRFNIRTGGSK